LRRKLLAFQGKRERGVAAMPHLESGVVWGTVLVAAGVLVVLNALGLEIGLSPFFGILLLVAGALVLFRVLRLEMATRDSRGGGGEVAALMEYLQSGLVWGTLLFIGGAVLVLDALGLEIVSEAFWGLELPSIGLMAAGMVAPPSGSGPSLLG
jgi:uncharacterized membrane protein HdeD (DUF308 family)